MRLPLATAPAGEGTTLAPSRRARSRLPKHAKLAIIEDSPDNREMLVDGAQSWLPLPVDRQRRRWPRPHRQASSRRRDHRDLGLPGMNGFELARRIPVHPQYASIRLVALTGYGMREESHARPRGRLRRTPGQADRAPAAHRVSRDRVAIAIQSRREGRAARRAHASVRPTRAATLARSEELHRRCASEGGSAGGSRGPQRSRTRWWAPRIQSPTRKSERPPPRQPNDAPRGTTRRTRSRRGRRHRRS